MASAATGLLTAMALAIATTAAAQDYPSRPVRIVVPYAAGGPSDTGTRLAAEPLGRELGRPIVIENRGGGGGLNATEAYVKSEHDGYTILVGAIGPLTIIPALKPVSYDPEKDFTPLGTVWRSAQVLAVRPSLGVKTMAEFVAYAKANPGKVTVGSAGVGAVTHLAIEVLKREASLDLIHVPFRSTSESLPALIGGQIDALVRRRSDHRAASAIRPHRCAGGGLAKACAGLAGGADDGGDRPSGRRIGELVRSRGVVEDAAGDHQAPAGRIGGRAARSGLSGEPRQARRDGGRARPGQLRQAHPQGRREVEGHHQGGGHQGGVAGE